MKKNRYRHRVEILRRRQSAAGSGGYGADEYEKIGEASCEIRDESEGVYAAAESARIEHVKTFAMRAREICSDDLLRWKGECYCVRRVDEYLHKGREIRVRASLSRSRYTVRGEANGKDND